MTLESIAPWVDDAFPQMLTLRDVFHSFPDVFQMIDAGVNMKKGLAKSRRKYA